MAALSILGVLSAGVARFGRLSAGVARLGVLSAEAAGKVQRYRSSCESAATVYPPRALPCNVVGTVLHVSGGTCTQYTNYISHFTQLNFVHTKPFAASGISLIPE